MIEIALKKELYAKDNSFFLDCNFTIEKGSLIGVYGESGVGKSSLLRMISGLLEPNSGSIKVNDISWFNSNKKINLSPQKRNIGFVFQDSALFPNMSVKENIAYAIPRSKDSLWLDELISKMDLRELENRSTETLSGGQKQRVALARALANKPDILLLDEALSALDYSMRSELQDYILMMHKELNLTTLMVSHDVGEISKMCDLLLIMENGKITRSGDVFSIFSNKQISGKFQFNGEILHIEPSDVIFIVSVLIGKNLVKVVVDEKTAKTLSIGDKVIVVSKAFNPLIYKI